MSQYRVQDDNDNCIVKVKAGTYAQTGKPQTEFAIIEKDHPNDHRHIVINEDGETVYDQYDQNKSKQS